MRTFTVEWMVDELVELFANYVYPIVDKIMIGEVRSVSVNIFTKGSREKDIYARTKLRNQEVISLYRVDIWLEDIMRLCRSDKMYLVTEEIFEVVALYYILQPLFVSKFMESPEKGEIFDSIYVGASRYTASAILDCSEKLTRIQKVALTNLYYTSLLSCNYNPPQKSSLERQLTAIKRYKKYMLANMRSPYITAVTYRANYYQVSPKGFIVLERANRKVHESYIIEKSMDFGISLGICVNPKINWEG